MGKVFAIVEPNWGGHQETQLQLFLEIILGWESKVIVLCPDPEGITRWLEASLPPAEHSRFYAAYYTGERQKCRFDKYHIWRNIDVSLRLAEEATEWTIDTVFLTYLDFTLPSLWLSWLVGRALPRQWAGLYFGPSYYRELVQPKWLNRWERIARDRLFFASRYCRGVGIFDEGVFRLMQAVLPPEKLFLFPDVTDEHLPAVRSPKIAEIVSKANGRVIVGLLGVLHPRKGVLNFLRSMQAVDPEKYFFLMVGPFKEEWYSSDERQELARLMAPAGRDNYHFATEWIADASEFNAYLSICDILFLVYKNFFTTSGLLTKAAVFEKPVIVSENYCMGERVENYNMGVTIRPDSVEDAVAALEELGNPETRRRFLEEARFAEFRSFHNKDILAKVLAVMLKD